MDHMWIWDTEPSSVILSQSSLIIIVSIGRLFNNYLNIYIVPYEKNNKMLFMEPLK